MDEIQKMRFTVRTNKCSIAIVDTESGVAIIRLSFVRQFRPKAFEPLMVRIAADFNKRAHGEEE
jgi:hypothetical protein